MSKNVQRVRHLYAWVSIQPPGSVQLRPRYKTAPTKPRCCHFTRLAQTAITETGCTHSPAAVFTRSNQAQHRIFLNDTRVQPLPLLIRKPFLSGLIDR